MVDLWLDSIKSKQKMLEKLDFKNTKTDEFYNMEFTKDETFFVSKGDISESQIKDFHFWLKKNLSFKELTIIELCAKNGILISETDFKH